MYVDGIHRVIILVFDIPNVSSAFKERKRLSVDTPYLKLILKSHLSFVIIFYVRSLCDYHGKLGKLQKKKERTKTNKQTSEKQTNKLTQP